MKNFPELGIQIPQIYLPAAGIDLTRWAVIACDQFTSQPDYWLKVESFVGDAPSTLRLTFPELFIEYPDAPRRIEIIQASMRQYLDKARKGIVIALDLECYDFNQGSSSLIRATEGTIIDRLPPRIKIRENADLELPHILVLIDDPGHTVIEPLSAEKNRLERIYDFDLMLDSGHLAGYRVNNESLEASLIEALRKLARPDLFAAKYKVNPGTPVLLFAMGDGNHSLATAKAIWEKLKLKVGMDHPARYALVEMENVHDEALNFEPIHRVLFGIKKDFYTSLESSFGVNYTYSSAANAEEMIKRVDTGDLKKQLAGFVGGGKPFGVGEFSNPTSNLVVGTLQPFLDTFLKEGNAEKIDYVHGEDVTIQLGTLQGNLGIYLPGMHKGDLFKTVILDGALPRKTFSMGEAREKRFYMEARKIA
jgi:hypothetical protein